MKSKKSFYTLIAIILICVMLPVMTQAAKIIWVSNAIAPVESGYEYWDEEYIFVLETAGYEVQREDANMIGTELTAEQIELLESGDLIIFSRANNSGDYIAPEYWNGLTKPFILQSCYLLRNSRWQWLNSTDLVDDGGAPVMRVEDPSHPIFEGVTLDANNEVVVLDSLVASGQTSFLNDTEVGGGSEILARRADNDAAWIVYWPEGVFFNDDLDAETGSNKLYFSMSTRESPGSDPFGWGVFNLTVEGERMFLNAVAWMLGESAVEKLDNAAPTEYALAENYPNPFNPETMIQFALPNQSQVQLTVYNTAGQEIITLVDAEYQSGSYEVQWDGRDQLGQAVESGVYICRIVTDDFVHSSKMILAK